MPNECCHVTLAIKTEPTASAYQIESKSMSESLVILFAKQRSRGNNKKQSVWPDGLDQIMPKFSQNFA